MDRGLGDRDKRADAAAYLATRSDSTALLALLTNDSDSRTAADATYGIARALISGIPDPSTVEIVEQLACEDRDIGLHIAAGLQTDDKLPPELAPIVQVLRTHNSARVRLLASSLRTAET